MKKLLILSISCFCCCMPYLKGAEASIMEVGGGKTFLQVQDALNSLPQVLEKPYLIRVHEGFYKPFSIKNKIVSKDNTLILEGQGNAVIDGENTAKTGIECSSSFVVIKNITVRNCIYAGIFIGGEKSFKGCVLQGNAILNSSNSIYYANTGKISDVIIEGNTITEGGGDGIKIFNAWGAGIKNNVIREKSNAGLAVSGNSGKILLSGNTFIGNRYGGAINLGADCEGFQSDNNVFTPAEKEQWKNNFSFWKNNFCRNLKEWQAMSGCDMNSKTTE